jgi:BirA family biotin operon repressor/biotin-[acetyl-CoA-carboxylase] ligase
MLAIVTATGGANGAGSRSAQGWPAGWHVRVVEETGSTNTDLLAAAQAGAPERSVLVARHQTAGRGRLDRSWETPAGTNLLVSLLVTVPVAASHEATQRVAHAAVDACRHVAGVTPVLKWPNDLLLDGAKLAGVLAQAVPNEGAAPSSLMRVVVGIGINVGWAPPGAALLGGEATPDAVLVALLRAYDALPADIHELYRNQLATLGEQVRAELPGGGSIVGRAVDVDPDGRLVILDGCAVTHRVGAADVVHLRPAT